MARMIVPAYERGGNLRPDHMLCEGDLIEWKRNGYIGFQLARVTALYPEAKRPVRIVPIDRGTRYAVGRQRWIGKEAVMIVCYPDGTRKEPWK